MAKELLKEAIADAKAVREVTLENAKMALEEAFDSKIKNMLSAKLVEEIEEDVELEETYMEDEKDEDMKEGQVNELAGLAVIGSIAAAAGGIEALLKKGRAGKLEPGSKMEKVYNAIEGAASGAGAARRSEGVDDLEETFDIDALISEIEADLDEETVDEGATGYDEKVGGKGRTGFDEKVGGKGRTGYDGAVKKLEEERDEAMATVTSLQETLSEMNLLNSKLLYCNKLFRANALTEAQKVKVVDALDMANTANEAKLVFNTLQESFSFTGVEKRAIQEGLGRASKASGTAPKKVITESVDETVSRFQKLANIKF